MKFYTLASSSAGNAALVCHNDTRLLIDAGISCRRITQSLAVLNLTLDDLDGILITHEHIDHVRALGTLQKKHAVPLYASIGTAAALDYPDSRVTAWDISDDALRIARANATRLGAQVCFERQDALAPPADTALWDVIVSNPPYICMSERAGMSPHVLDHEPATALFVPDSDPLLFYRAIARYATRALKPGGTLLFEINALYASETSAMLHALGFAASVERDQYDRPRFIIARL